MRYLKYTPEHMHCFAVFHGPSTPPSTGLLAYQANNYRSFRISATGVVLELETTATVFKKLKLVGELPTLDYPRCSSLSCQRQHLLDTSDSRHRRVDLTNA